MSDYNVILLVILLHPTKSDTFDCKNMERLNFIEYEYQFGS